VLSKLNDLLIYMLVYYMLLHEVKEWKDDKLTWRQHFVFLCSVIGSKVSFCNLDVYVDLLSLVVTK